MGIGAIGVECYYIRGGLIILLIPLTIRPNGEVLNGYVKNYADICSPLI